MPEKADESSQGERTLPFEKGRVLSPWTPYLLRKPLCRVRPPEERDGRGGLPKKTSATAAPSGRRMAQKSGFLLEGGVGKLLFLLKEEVSPTKTPYSFSPFPTPSPRK